MVMNIRDGRNELTLELLATLTKIVEERKNKANYYILIQSVVDNENNDIIRNKVILLNKRLETPLIGTILYFVDNRRGRLERIWCLPRDVYQPETLVTPDDYSDEIFHIGKAPNK